MTWRFSTRASDLTGKRLFCHFILPFSFILFHRLAPFTCRFVYFRFVVSSLSLIRERRGALLLALNEESAAKVIATDSSRQNVFPIKIVFNFTYLRE